MNYPDEYQHALRIQKMAEMLENQLKHAKSKQEMCIRDSSNFFEDVIQTFFQ